MADRIINGVEYYKLYMKCPVCLERGNETVPTYWSHAKDDGDIYVGSDAKYYCDVCKINEHVMRWAYKCPQCSNADDYFVGEEGGFAAEAIGASFLQLVKIAGLPWLREFLGNLE